MKSSEVKICIPELIRLCDIERTAVCRKLERSLDIIEKRVKNRLLADVNVSLP